MSFTTKRCAPLTILLKVIPLPVNVASVVNKTALLNTCEPLVVKFCSDRTVPRNAKLAACETFNSPIQRLLKLLSVMSASKLAFRADKLVVLEASTAVPAACVMLPPLLVIPKAPVVLKLPRTIGVAKLANVLAPPTVRLPLVPCVNPLVVTKSPVIFVIPLLCWNAPKLVLPAMRKVPAV